MKLPLIDKKFLVVMRHEKSIAAVYGFVSGLGASITDFQAFVLERDKDSEKEFKNKKSELLAAIRADNYDMIILATKVNDAGKNSELVSLLQDLQQAGLDQQPVLLTHLEEMNTSQKATLAALGLNLHIIENDNLGFPKAGDPHGSIRTGMSQLGSKILEFFGPH